MQHKVLFQAKITGHDYRVCQDDNGSLYVDEYNWRDDGTFSLVDDVAVTAHVYMLCCLNQQEIINAFGSRKLV
jgi:hypothetical protein